MDKNMKISVIMPVHLSPYYFGSFRSASEPEVRYIRAISSFLDQSFKDAELIIVADGCRKAEEIYYELFQEEPNILFKYIDKQINFSGVVRQTGIDLAMGEIICYLDHDDKFGVNHLAIIDECFDTDKYDWVYYNDILIHNTEHTIREVRNVKPVQSSIGTSAIAHKKSIGVVWGDGYGHDLRMIQTYLLPLPHTKIPTPQYYVCHCSGLNIDF
jgi:glycosyltransferase involved in cell wall biosynthesis